MPQHIEKQPDGTYKVYTEQEYREKNDGAIGVFIIFIVGLIISGIYATFVNFMNFDAIKDFGLPLYFNNFKHFHGHDECIFIQGHPYSVDPDDTLSSLLMFPYPLDFANAPRAVEMHIFDQYSNQASAWLPFPVMVRYRGYLYRDFKWQTDTDKGEGSVYWSAISVDIAGKVVHGYIPYDLPNGIQIEEDLSEIDIGDDVIDHYKLDREKITGNRFAARLDDRCKFRIVEL